MLTLLQHGALHAPEPLGETSILLAAERILRIGDIDPAPLHAAGLGFDLIDARDCLIVPGLVDPHAHLIGAGGEQGFASRQPEVAFDELARAGVTTVVGCLGTDTITRTLEALLAKARQLRAQGIGAHLYTGGFQVPAPTITGSVTRDLVLIPEIIGVGEVAIADKRSSAPTVVELAKLASEVVVGGMISGKTGVLHFHTGPSHRHLSILHALLDEHDVPPERLYATHVQRSEALMDDAIALARRGAFVDIDVIDEDLEKWLRYYRDHGGPMDRLTASSDAHTVDATHDKLYRQLVACVVDHRLPIAEVLPLFTANPAKALSLPSVGRLAEGLSADLLVLRRDTLEIVHVFARGRCIVRDGQLQRS